MATFASSATTLVSNIQARGQSSVVALADVIEELKRLLQDDSKGKALEKFIPPTMLTQQSSDWDSTEYVNTLAEAFEDFEKDIDGIKTAIEGTADKFKQHFSAIEAQVLAGAGSKKSFDVSPEQLEKIRRGTPLTETEKQQLEAAGADLSRVFDSSLPVTSARTVSGAAAASDAFRLQAEQKRKEAEVELLERAAGSKFYRIPGYALSDILAVREKALDQVGEHAAKVFTDEQSTNAQLYVQWAVSSYGAAVSIATQFANFSTVSVQIVSSLIADYDNTLAYKEAERTRKIAELEGKLRFEYSKLAKAIQDVEADHFWFEQIRPVELDLYLRRFDLQIYKTLISLFKPEEAAIAGILAQALRDAGNVASRATAAIGASGSFTERGFS